MQGAKTPLTPAHKTASLRAMFSRLHSFSAATAGGLRLRCARERRRGDA
jgi:hypothetical protein